MKRRDWMAGMALAGMGLEAQQHGPDSLYIPKPHLVEDRKFLHDFMDEFAFVDLVTASPNIRITHIPVLLDRKPGPYGAILGHISRQNPQKETFDGAQSAVIVFRGPHSYISPGWYSKPEAVPTWNFAVVHASGKLKPITDRANLHGLVARLIDKFEIAGKSGYDLAKLPDSYVNGMLGGIVGFEMQIELLEGKFKLGQERPAADREGILRNLRDAKQGPNMHDFTAAFYERGKTA